MQGQIIKRVALGGTPPLGRFWNLHRDEPVSAVEVWSQEEIKKKGLFLGKTSYFPEKDAVSFESAATHYKIALDESASDSMSNFDLDISLKASFLGGLVNVSGSANYLNNKRASSSQERVTFQYTTHVGTAELPTHVAPETDHVKQLDAAVAQGATHVVSKLYYGCRCVLSFEHSKSDAQNEQKIGGTLKVLVKSIPTLEIDAQGTVKIEGDDKTLSDKTTVSLECDIAYQGAISSFTQAMQFVQKFDIFSKNATSVLYYDLIPLTAYSQPLGSPLAFPRTFSRA